MRPGLIPIAFNSKDENENAIAVVREFTTGLTVSNDRANHANRLTRCKPSEILMFYWGTDLKC